MVLTVSFGDAAHPLLLPPLPLLRLSMCQCYPGSLLLTYAVVNLLYAVALRVRLLAVHVLRLLPSH